MLNLWVVVPQFVALQIVAPQFVVLQIVAFDWIQPEKPEKKLRFFFLKTETRRKDLRKDGAKGFGVMDKRIKTELILNYDVLFT